MHAGSRDLLLYQHRARCTLGASCLPFISTEATEMQAWCVCICRTWWRIIFFGCATEREQNVSMCVFVCWQVFVRAEGADPKPLPGDLGSLSLQRTTRARHASEPAKVGNPVYMEGAALAGPVANTRAWHLHLLPPPMEVSILNHAGMHNAASFPFIGKCI